MKKLNFYTFIISVFIFLSCEKKADPVPATPILKGFKLESKSTSRTVNGYFTLVYSNEKLMNMQRLDTINEGGSLKISPLLNNILSEETPDNFKLVSDFAFSSGQTYTITPVTNTSKKNGDNYDIVTYYLPTLSVYSTIELNGNKQVSKCLNIKTISTDNNGNKIEAGQNSYYRYEYDSNGNIVKVLHKNNGSNAEVLAAEYTYDSNPNPMQVLKWVFRLSGISPGIATSESNNNVIISRQYYGDGSLKTETKSEFTYDNVSKYPLTQTTTATINSPNAVTPTKTIYRY